MSLSLCMIAKDEANCIGTALKSAYHFVDEIIVVDTGSNDDTVAIAKSFGAIIHTSPWQKDFSYHRNEALSLATKDWILILDCDEELEQVHLQELRSKILSSSDSCKAYNVSTVNVIDSIPLVRFDAVRLFRNHHNFHFEGPIHEQVIPSIQTQYGLGAIHPLPLTILHHGYTPQVMKEKNKVERNLDILKKIPNKTGYLYAMIGDEYYKSQSFSLAVKYYQKSLKVEPSLHSYYSLLLIMNYSTSLISLSRYLDALHFIQKALKVYPLFKDLYFISFWIHYHLTNYALALTFLDQYTTFKQTPHVIEIKKYYQIYNIPELRADLLSHLEH